MDKNNTPTLFFRAGAADEIKALSDNLIVAIDLGFSKTDKSCGVATWDGQQLSKTQSLTFGHCIAHVAQLMVGHNKVVLIIEAPLCGLMGDNGNPKERGSFEKSVPGAATSGTRYWYSGSGGAVCLGAIVFLRALLATLKSRLLSHSLEIVLFEGFVTFKPKTVTKPAKTKVTSHGEDANKLLDCFVGKGLFKAISLSPEHGESLFNIVDVVNERNVSFLPTQAPTIILPQFRVSVEFSLGTVKWTHQVDVSNRDELQHWLREQKVQSLILEQVFLDNKSYPKSNFAIDELTDEDFRLLTTRTSSTEFVSLCVVGSGADAK